MKKKYSTCSTDARPPARETLRSSLSTRHSPATAGRRRIGEGGFVNLRALLGFALCSLGVVLALFAHFSPLTPSTTKSDMPRYMPVPGDSSQSEAAGLSQLEQYWHDR